MRVTLAQLEAFYWIMRLGSFHEAARQIRRTQPSISLRIRELESALGETVLERYGQKVRVTPAGARLLSYADRVLLLTSELEANVSNRRPALERLRLGAIDPFAITCLPQLLKSIETLYPGTHVELTIDYSINLRKKLNAQELDICFVIDPDDQPFLWREFLCSIEQIWVGSSADDRWKDGVFGPRDLADEVVFGLPDPARPMVMGWFGASGMEPSRLRVCNNLGVTTRLIEAGLGIGIVYRCMVEAELAKGSLTQIRTAPTLPPASLHLAYLDRFRFQFRNLIAEAREIVAQRGRL